MKFQQLMAFKKHLEKASPDHLSRVYLVVAPCAFERKKISKMICVAIEKRERSITPLAFDAKEWSWAKVRAELDTVVMLGGHRVVIVEEVDKLKKQHLEPLISYISKPSPFASLILAATSGKELLEFYELAKKELVICDLSMEKPWERKERLKAYLVAKAAKEGKVLIHQAAEMLIEKTSADLAMLEQEIDKLLCYCQDKKQITSQDVEVLCCQESSASLWHLAECIVWWDSLVRVDTLFEFSSFLFLITQVRSHLQQGMLLALQLKQDKPLKQPSFFKPQLLEKITPIVQKRPLSFFIEGLSALFEVEMLAKNSHLSPLLLLDLLIAKIRRLARV